MRPVGSKYLLEETLGRGAMGTVWRGRVREDAGVADLAPGQPVAIKVLKEELAADQDIVLRFLRERSVLLRLNHPNIVRVRDLVVEGELLALVMDLVDGPDLYRYLRTNGPLSPIAAALLTAQIADALAASHADGVVHRDLKPANVLLATVPGPDGQGEALHPMLTDFGIARLADSPGITRTSEFVGTPSYVAPESASGRPQTEAVDIYGAGIMLYELLTGRPPFQGDGALQILQAHLTQEPPRPPAMPEPLWIVVERCLRKDPAQRPSATSLARALRVVAAGVGVHAAPAAVDAALAVGALLVPPQQPAQVPGTGSDPTQAFAPQYDPAAATQVLPAEGTRVLPAEGTRVMPPTRVMPGMAPQQSMSQPPQSQQPPAMGVPPVEGRGTDAPHPWQTQLRAARDRNQQTQVFATQEYEPPQPARAGTRAVASRVARTARRRPRRRTRRAARSRAATPGRTGTPSRRAAPRATPTVRAAARRQRPAARAQESRPGRPSRRATTSRRPRASPSRRPAAAGSRARAAATGCTSPAWAASRAA
ncbi:serine/threonine-protein kinase [Kitasatospora acidiphila]|uniref:serine/threonine-protein kinase n=1 Tax=Kitasatospora acidiphila TaxID=2567942 RepID=UPI003898F9CC